MQDRAPSAKVRVVIDSSMAIFGPRWREVMKDDPWGTANLEKTPPTVSNSAGGVVAEKENSALVLPPRHEWCVHACVCRCVCVREREVRGRGEGDWRENERVCACASMLDKLRLCRVPCAAARGRAIGQDDMLAYYEWVVARSPQACMRVRPVKEPSETGKETY